MTASVPLSKAPENLAGIRPSTDFPVHERLGVYRYAYHARLHESLQEDFPRTEALLGADRFSAFCREYLESYPPTSWTLGVLGEHLAAFAQESTWSKRFAWLSAAVAFEWAHVLASCWPLVPVADFAAIAGLSAAQQDALVLTLNPSLQLQASAWAVHRTRPYRQETFYAVVRSAVGGSDTHFWRMPKVTWDLLCVIQKGVTFGKLEFLHAKDEDLLRDIAFFVRHKIVVGFHTV